MIFSLDSSVQCCPMLLLWAWVWSNLAGAAWPLSCCCQEPHCDDDDGLSWPRPHSSLSSSPHSSKLMVPVMWRLSLPPSSHCSMAQLSRTDCLPASARLCPPCCRDVTPGHTRVTTLRQRQGRHRGAEPITRYLGCLASTLFFLGLHFYLLTFITYDPPVPGTVRNCYLTLTMRFYQLIITSCYMIIGMFHSCSINEVKFGYILYWNY